MNSDKEIAIGLAVIALMLFFVASVQVENKKEWRAFAEQHHCTKAGYTGGRSALSTGRNKLSAERMQDNEVNANIFSRQVAWLCDDGKTYWRESESDAAPL